MELKSIQALEAFSRAPYRRGSKLEEAYVRCLKSDIQGLIPGALYRVRDVLEAQNGASTAFSYKLDGFANGITCDKFFRAEAFERWVPVVGDLVQRGKQSNPLLITSINREQYSQPLTFGLHEFRAEKQEWVPVGELGSPNIVPMMGETANLEVVREFLRKTHPQNTIVSDSEFVVTAKAEVPAAEDSSLATDGDRARERRLSTLKTTYKDSMIAALAANDQYMAQMGQYLDGGDQLRRIGERLGLVEPPVKRK